jgi:hypothetical protein
MAVSMAVAQDCTRQAEAALIDPKRCVKGGTHIPYSHKVSGITQFGKKLRGGGGNTTPTDYRTVPWYRAKQQPGLQV